MANVESDWRSDNRGQDSFVSDSQRHVATIVNYVFLNGGISLFGVVANVINMLIFYSHGLTTTTNISFFAMAVSDLCSLLLQQLFNVFLNPLCVDLDWPIDYTDMQHMTGGIPREAFARITCLITVYITAERCLCIAFPLHVKQMITPRRTAIVISCFFIFSFAYIAPLYITSYIGAKYDAQRNKTVQGIVATGDNEAVQAGVFLFHGITGVLSFLAVVVLTFILVRKLSQKSAWREAASARQDKSMSKKDRSIMSMVALIATILIVCYTPAVLVAATTFLVPEFNVRGRYFNLYFVMWSLAFMFENINSSVNIFLYLKMSSKFRRSFVNIFSKSSLCCCPCHTGSR